MLRKDMRKKLQEHTWLEIARTNSNPSDTLRRLIDEANRAINDLILLADKLPNNKQAEIFRYDNLNRLLVSVLRGSLDDSSSPSDKNLLGRYAHLSSLLATTGIRFCKNIYEHHIEQNPALKKATVEKLDDATEVCNAIAFKTYAYPSSSYGSGLVFLFNWNNITDVKTTNPEKVQGDDNIRLIHYLNEEITAINRIRIVIGPYTEKKEQRKDFKEIVCYFSSEHLPGENVCDFAINDVEQTVNVDVYNVHNLPRKSKTVPVEPILEKSLVVKKEGKDLRVYRQSKFWEY
jgi:hypothetical protein